MGSKYNRSRIRYNKTNAFKGCGIPQSPLKTSSGSFSDSSLDSTLSINNQMNSHNILNNILIKLKGETDAFKCSDTKKTWIITHPTCLHHLATPEPTDAPNKRNRLIVTYPENPTRLEVIISNDNGILRSETLNNVKLIHSPPPASLADILRVHDWGYIDKLLGQIQIAQKRWATHPYWPVLADGDTPITPHSWNAALYAAGSVISAVDAVCTNACRNAFCAVRPPGHHLGTWGGAQSSNFEDEDFAAGSQGFCLINNVAIGAAYAKYTYGAKGIRRIAIVDFDVHHGNGTEQIIRNVGPKDIKSFITHSNNNDGEVYVESHTIHKHWFGWRDYNDAEEILFASIHAYDGIFYPGTGKPCTIYDDSNRPNIINVAVPQAGFDGHYRDSVSYGFTKYTEKDFYFVTERLVTIANSICDGRIISVLEGGYNTRLNSLSPFARSVLEHVSALCHTNTKSNYPYMYGENIIDLLLSPVLSYKIDNIYPEYDSNIIKIINELRQRTENIIKRAYSLGDLDYCKFSRLFYYNDDDDEDFYYLYPNTLQFYGNFFFNFYSRNFYSLYNIGKFIKLNHKKCNELLEGGDDDNNHIINNNNNLHLYSKNQYSKIDSNKLLQCNEWFRNIKLNILKQNVNVAELLYRYLSYNSSAFIKKCPIHS